METKIIGIIIALEDELYQFKSIFEKGFNVHVSLEQKFYITYHNNNMFVFSFSGIGKTNAAMTASNLIKTFNSNAIINLGSCGSCFKDASIKDIYLIDDFYFLDVDATAFKYELGQTPKESPYFTSSALTNEKILKILNDHNINIKKGKCGTSDSFINKLNFEKVKNKLFSLVSCIDMESASIAQVCSKTKTLFSSIKIVSDNLNNSVANNDVQFQENLSDISKMLTNIVTLIINNIDIN